MAIVTMKKLRLLAIRSEKDDLLRDLEKLGCVEFSELDDALAESGLERENSDILALRGMQNTLTNAIGLLDRYAPQKTPLLSSKPEVSTDVLLDDELLQKALEGAQRINGLEDKIKRLTAEEARQNSVLESVKPWLELDVPLDTVATERSSVIWGSVPARVELASVSAAVEEASEEAELFLISSDRSNNHVLVVCIKEALPEVQDSLRKFGFAAISFSGETATAAEAKVAAEKALQNLAEEKEATRAEIVKNADLRQDLKLASDIAAAKMSRAEAEGRLMGTESTLVMQGWVPEEREADLEALLERYGCAWETELPDEEEYPKVPVQLKNNRITDALNMVTNMYSLPAYGSVDPNPVMAPPSIARPNPKAIPPKIAGKYLAAALIRSLRFIPRIDPQIRAAI